MTVTWQLVTLVLGWTGFLIGIIKWLLNREITALDARIKSATDAAKANATALADHRNEYLRFLAQLPLDYYRREDMIRFETLTHAKLDALATDIRQLECSKCKMAQ